jgi:hypothetical protein
LGWLAFFLELLDLSDINCRGSAWGVLKDMKKGSWPSWLRLLIWQFRADYGLIGA